MSVISTVPLTQTGIGGALEVFVMATAMTSYSLFVVMDNPVYTSALL